MLAQKSRLSQPVIEVCRDTMQVPFSRDSEHPGWPSGLKDTLSALPNHTLHSSLWNIHPNFLLHSFTQGALAWWSVSSYSPKYFLLHRYLYVVSALLSVCLLEGPRLRDSCSCDNDDLKNMQVIILKWFTLLDPSVPMATLSPFYALGDEAHKEE